MTFGKLREQRAPLSGRMLGCGHHAGTAAPHRNRYSSSLRKLPTITPEFSSRCAGFSVHVDLEALSIMSRHTHLDFCMTGFSKESEL